MKIVVLAGGEGKRMWPIQTDKCLIPFLGKPLLYHNLKQIKENLRQTYNGRDINVLIIANPQSKQEISKIAQSLGLNFQVAVQNEPKGMADAILSAKDLIKEEVLVVNAEDILEASIYKEILEVGGDVVVPGLRVKSYFPGGYLRVEGESIKGIVEKPREGNEPSDMVKLVVDHFKDGNKLVEYLQKAQSSKNDVYEVALNAMIKDGLDVRFSKYDGVWVPLKYPWHILDITAYFLSKLEPKISPQAKISDKAIIEGDVVIEAGVRVFEGAVIKGPVFIGKNSIVGNNSLIREANLEERCVTGFSSDITRSYIGANCWFHTNYIGDSCLEGDFGMGSGAIAANLRLDNQMIRVGPDKIVTNRVKLGLLAGKGVRVGVNACTMPGVRIGANSLVGPGVVLKRDLKENQKITLKEESFEIQDYQAVAASYSQFKDKLDR